MENKFHTIIIGGGPGGVRAAIKIARAGKKVAIVNNELGGECLNWGCIPTKTLLWVAELFERAKRAKPAGLEVDNPRLNFEQMLKRKNQVVSMLGKGVEMNLIKAGVEIVHGFGEIVGGNAGAQPSCLVKVTTDAGSTSTLESEYLVIATGSAPAMIPSVTLSDHVLDNRGILGLSEIPKSVTIVGGGVIGCEYGSLFAALGSEVTIIEHSTRLLMQEDQETSDFIQKLFARQKITVLTESTVRTIKDYNGDDAVSSGGAEISFQNKAGEDVSLKTSKVLIAVGRQPVIPRSSIVIETNGRGIATNEYDQSSVANIYAIGDVAGKALLAYSAELEGDRAAAHILGKPIETPLDYSSIPNAIFSEPTISSIGVTEKTAREKYPSITIGKSSYGSNGKALIMGDRDGMVKLIFEGENKRLIGAHIIGVGAPDLIPFFSLALNQKNTLTELAKTIFPHPILAEVIKEAIENAQSV
ncbi:MAG: dihydrolipoyl dehydrogenase [Patescibacteria group bacterium]